MSFSAYLLAFLLRFRRACRRSYPMWRNEYGDAGRIIPLDEIAAAFLRLAWWRRGAHGVANAAGRAVVVCIAGLAVALLDTVAGLQAYTAFETWATMRACCASAWSYVEHRAQSIDFRPANSLAASNAMVSNSRGGP